jgi:hypothetical protein
VNRETVTVDGAAGVGRPLDPNTLDVAIHQVSAKSNAGGLAHSRGREGHASKCATRVHVICDEERLRATCADGTLGCGVKTNGDVRTARRDADPVVPDDRRQQAVRAVVVVDEDATVVGDTVEVIVAADVIEKVVQTAARPSGRRCPLPRLPLVA